MPDHEFVAELRQVVERYLSAVDHWDEAYQKYYRLPGFASRVSDDLQEEQREYEVCRRDLAAMLPRARRLCLKHRLREPFSGLLRISLDATPRRSDWIRRSGAMSAAWWASAWWSWTTPAANGPWRLRERAKNRCSAG